MASSSPRRAWIEISKRALVKHLLGGRPPHGGRGLKWRLWGKIGVSSAGRPPHGGRGLKWREHPYYFNPCGSRPPHGGRGLKYYFSCYDKSCNKSSSPRRAWIEIMLLFQNLGLVSSSSPRRAWIEISEKPFILSKSSSRPPHGGRGLKLQSEQKRSFCQYVVLPTEGVD